MRKHLGRFIVIAGVFALAPLAAVHASTTGLTGLWRTFDPGTGAAASVVRIDETRQVYSARSSEPFNNGELQVR